MKTFLFICIALLSAQAMAQQSFKVVYKEQRAAPSSAQIEAKRAKLQEVVKNPSIVDGILKKMGAVPEPAAYTLSIAGHTSLYEMTSAKPTEGPIVQKDDILYINTEAKQLVEQKHIFEKPFRIEEPLLPIAWKLTDQTKTVLSFQAKHAYATIDGATVEVWYVPNIKSNAGPKGLWGLPGLIVEAKYADGTQISLQSLTPVPNLLVEAPKSGAKTSRKNFEEKRIQHFEQLGQAFGQMPSGN